MDLSRLLPAADPSDLTERLRTVVDPEIGVNVVDLGLVYACDVHAGVAHVLMTTTTPACPIGSFLEDQVRWALLEAPGGRRRGGGDHPCAAWSPALMTAAARPSAGQYRMTALPGAGSPGRGVARGRLVFLAVAGTALLTGLTGALMLLGVALPSSASGFALAHGELMSLGFLGTVVALERAVALDEPWGYLAPGLAAVGAIGLMAGLPAPGSAGLVGGAIVLLAVYAAFARRERSLQLGVQAAGAGAWLGAALLLRGRRPRVERLPVGRSPPSW